MSCEQLGDRIVPTVTYFEYDPGGGSLSGWVDYDDAEVDASDSSQTLDLTDVGFIYDGEEYGLADVESGASVYLSYGRVVGFDFITHEVGNNPELEVVADDGTITIDDGEDEYPFDVAIYNYDAVALDTSGSTTGATFYFTLSNGTLAQGEFVMDSEDVPVPDPEAPGVPVNVAVTDFTLKVGSVTFDESDCASTPTASFDADGIFVGVNYSIQNITGQAYTAITGSGGIVTITFASAPTEVKPEVLAEKLVAMDTSKLATGLAYRITIKVWQVGNAVAVGTAVINVVANDTTADIRDKIIQALKKKDIFVHPVRSTDSIIIGGKANDNDTGQSLAKISIETEMHDLFGWYYEDLFDWQNGGLVPSAAKPIMLYNGNTINP